VSAAPEIRGAGRRAAHSDAVEWLARGGFVARGLVYAIIGVLAFKLAMGIGGGRTTDQQGALDTIAHQPFGRPLLIATAIGLAGYALWRFVQAGYGYGPEGGGGHSAFKRVAALASGIAYALMCLAAVMILSGSQSSSARPKKATAGVLGWPGGQVIVFVVGALLIGVGLYQGYRAVTKAFLEDSKTEEMSKQTLQLVTIVGVVGNLARMVVFTMVGVFLARAAYDYRPRGAIGLDGALAKLAHQTYGPVLLAIVSASLVAFAVHSFSDARYRRT
jgi:hypothetical protein